MTDLDKSKAELIAKLSAMKPPRLSALATGNEILATRDHLDELAGLVDAYIGAVGAELRSCTTTNSITSEGFASVLANAMGGNAGYEIETAAFLADEEAHELAVA